MLYDLIPFILVKYDKNMSTILHFWVVQQVITSTTRPLEATSGHGP